MAGSKNRNASAKSLARGPSRAMKRVRVFVALGQIGHHHGVEAFRRAYKVNAAGGAGDT